VTIDVLNFYEDHPKIYIHRLIHNYGLPSFARNYGITKSQGEFIAFMDDDDISYLDRIEKQLEVFKNMPEIDVVGC
jgi:glycosyltransferase involved in cell wall biosynthesis